jgi:hypothetical protein
MTIRRLPDGSVLNTDTGDLMVMDAEREAAARRISERSGGYKAPVRNKGQQVMQVTQVGKQVVLEPVTKLAVSQYSALGEASAPTTAAAAPKPAMSDSMKRLMLMGGLVAAAYGVVWVSSKMGKGKGKK